MLVRKSTMGEIDALKKKKRQLKTDVEALLKTADEFADRAEHSRNITWIAKSNSLRRTAKDKMTALKDIEEKLDGKLQQLKNNYSFHSQDLRKENYSPYIYFPSCIS